MKVLLAHPGTQYSFQLARQLYKRDMLYEFHTGLAFGKDSVLFKILSRLPARIFHKVSNRFIDDVPDRFLKRHPFIEIKALLRLKFGGDEENVLYTRNRKFQNDIPTDTLQQVDVVIGFDTSSWILAENCMKMSRRFILDVSIAHPVSKDKVYRQIIKLYPRWKFSVKQKSHKHIAIEEAEMELADHIVVASRFTLNTYVEHGIKAGKISINSYGVDANLFKPRHKQPGDIIRFVFVGLVDARKGIPFLLEVWNKLDLGNIELTLIGPVTPGIENFIQANYPSVILMGKLSFNEVKDRLPDYDVLIFPSFFEGFGLVIPEAMASGLPVITTTSTCGPDIIENGQEGFLIGPGNDAALRTSIEYFVKAPHLILEKGLQARRKIEQFSWDAYGERWVHVLDRSLKSKQN